MRTNPVLKALLNSRGQNSKLGPVVYSWSLPPGVTCPGQSEICRRICYAKNICGRYPEVDPAWRKNLKLSERPDFPKLLALALEQLQERESNRSKRVLLRIHVGGDFYSPAYLQAWTQAIVYANCDESVPVIPWAYTRIWRVPWLVSSLQSPWPAWLWCSNDPSTETVCQWVNEAKMIPYPRDSHKRDAMTQWKRRLVADRRTCPHLAEKFHVNPEPPTCQQCGRCWDPEKIRPQKLGRGRVILFPQHR